MGRGIGSSGLADGRRGRCFLRRPVRPSPPLDRTRGAPIERPSSTSDVPVRLWHELTSPQVGALQSDTVVVLPLAAVEQHGPHLPLSTDADIALGLVAAAFRALPDDLPVYVLPLQMVGVSPEHEDYPGTVSLPPAVVEQALSAIGASLARAGVRRLVLFNSHGGNRAVMDTAALRLRRERHMLVVKATYTDFPRPERVVLPDSEWVHGMHGGAVETAMMMHLRPDLVRRDALRPFPSLGEEIAADLDVLRPEGPASFAWTARDLNPHGVVGDPTIAGAEAGEHLVDHYGAYLARVVQDAHAFPLERLADGGAQGG